MFWDSQNYWSISHKITKWSPKITKKYFLFKIPLKPKSTWILFPLANIYIFADCWKFLAREVGPVIQKLEMNIYLLNYFDKWSIFQWYSYSRIISQYNNFLMAVSTKYFNNPSIILWSLNAFNVTSWVPQRVSQFQGPQYFSRFFPTSFVLNNTL